MENFAVRFKIFHVVVSCLTYYDEPSIICDRQETAKRRRK